MRGEFIGVWLDTWREIWLPLIDQEDVPDDIFCELYRELALALKARPTIEELADVIDNQVQSREAFEKTRPKDIVSERAIVTFLEAAQPALEDLGGDALSSRYFILLGTLSTSSACATTCAVPAPCARPCRGCSRASCAICAPWRVGMSTSTA